MMSTDFFRFPHTPHLAWLGNGTPRDDKVLAPAEAMDFLDREVVVEEKLDGANMGISIGPEGTIQIQNRGQYLTKPYLGQFKKVEAWLSPREDALFDALGGDLILFGEWCAARHSLSYDALPDWLLVFDVFDRNVNRFWSTIRRDRLAEELALATVPHIGKGHFSLPVLVQVLLQQSSVYRSGPVEGFVLRREGKQWLDDRVKLVHPDFTQAIEEHWSHRAILWNQLKK